MSDHKDQVDPVRLEEQKPALKLGRGRRKVTPEMLDQSSVQFERAFPEAGLITPTSAGAAPAMVETREQANDATISAEKTGAKVKRTRQAARSADVGMFGRKLKETRPHQTTFRLSFQERVRLEKAAERHGLVTAEYIRHAVFKAVEEDERQYDDASRTASP